MLEKRKRTMKTGLMVGLFAGATGLTAIAVMPPPHTKSFAEMETAISMPDADTLIGPSCVVQLYGDVERNPSKNEIALHDWIVAVNATSYYNGKMSAAFALRQEIPAVKTAPTKAECIARAQQARHAI